MNSEVGALGPVDKANPWPGLAPYSEGSGSFFRGRDYDVDALMEAIKEAPITTLTGRSGVGKTSLVRAGLYPALRAANYFPVALRFDLRRGVAPLIDQLRSALRSELKRQGIEVRGARDESTLWRQLHGRELKFLRSGQELTPVFVLDEAEELFTLGLDQPELIEAFQNDLADLVENRIPADLVNDLRDRNVAAALDLRRQNYKFLLVLREDLHPQLESWRRLSPKLEQSVHRLSSLTAQQAFDAILQPDAGLVDEALAWRIVRFLIAAQAGSVHSRITSIQEVQDSPVPTGNVEPAWLSVFCWRINERRKRQGLDRITDDVLQGSPGSIIVDHYRACLEELADSVSTFIEMRLVSDDNYRLTIGLSDAVPNLISQEQLDWLVQRGILRVEAREGEGYLELAHDLLVWAVREHQVNRHTFAEQPRDPNATTLASLQYTAPGRRKLLWLAASAATVFAVASAAAGFGWYRAQNQVVAMTASELALRSELLAKTKTAAPDAAGLLAAGGYATDPGPAAAAGLLTAITDMAQVERIAKTESPPGASAFSPAGKVFVSGNADGSVVFWDVATRKPLGPTEAAHKGPIGALAFSPNGETLATGSRDQTIVLWDVAARRPSGSALRGHKGTVLSVAFSPDGKRLVSSSEDGAIVLWEVDTGLALWRVEKPADKPAEKPAEKPAVSPREPYRGLAFRRDGRAIFAGTAAGEVITLDAATGQVTGTPLPGDANAVVSTALSSDGQLLASGDFSGKLRLWNALTGEPLGEAIQAHTGPLWSLAFSPDSKTVASAGADGLAALWDVTTRERVGDALRGGKQWLVGVDFSPDGERLLTASADGNLVLWDTKQRQPLGEPLRGQRGAVMVMAFSPDSQRMVSGTRDGVLYFWNAKTHELLGEPSRGHDSAVSSAAFSPDGKRLVSGGADGTVVFWNAQTRVPIGTAARAHKAAVLGIAFSPDGKRLITGSTDGDVVLWDATKLEPLGPPLSSGATAVLDMAFSPDGKTAVAGHPDGSFTLWDTDPRSWRRKLCAKMPRDLTPAEWATYAGANLEYRAQCGASG